MLLLLSIVFTLASARCSSFCINGETQKLSFTDRIAKAVDLVVVTVTSDPDVRPAIGYKGEYSFVYTATVHRVLKGCMQAGQNIRIHQIRKTGTGVSCPNPYLKHAAELAIWTGKAKKAQGVRSSPVPRMLVPKNGKFLLSGCRVGDDANLFFVNPCGIAQAVKNDWELAALAGNKRVRALLGPGLWSTVPTLMEKSASVEEIWRQAAAKQARGCTGDYPKCHVKHPGHKGDKAAFAAHKLSLTTSGGKWTAYRYRVSAEEKDGAEMELHFLPKKSIKGSKIALIQTNLKIERGKNYDELTRAKVLDGKAMAPEIRKDGRSDGFAHIDRAISANNPIYGAPDLTLNGLNPPGIDQTPVGVFNPPPTFPEKIPRDFNMVNYQLGSSDGTVVSAAKLYDLPLCKGCPSALAKSLDLNEPVKKRSSFTFETAAVVVSGPDAGKWLGSVEWGFSIHEDACVKSLETGKFNCHTILLPFTVKSQKNPSGQFKACVAQWNKSFYRKDPPQKNPQIFPVP